METPCGFAAAGPRKASSKREDRSCNVEVNAVEFEAAANDLLPPTVFQSLVDSEPAGTQTWQNP